jgi:hypothetical protein
VPLRSGAVDYRKDGDETEGSNRAATAPLRSNALGSGAVLSRVKA